MARFDGRRLGTWSLRLDAAYCLVLGVSVASASTPIAAVVSIPQPLIVATGIVVAVWAALVLWMLARLQLRSALRLLLGVNVLAALLIAAASMAAVSELVAIAVIAIAIDVALFAASQGIAILRLDRTQRIARA